MNWQNTCECVYVCVSVRDSVQSYSPHHGGSANIIVSDKAVRKDFVKDLLNSVQLLADFTGREQISGLLH